MKREDGALVKNELLKRQGISPEQLKDKGQVLKCTFPGSLRYQFEEINTISHRGRIWDLANSYVFIDGKIVNPKAKTNESFSSRAVAPKVIGTTIIENCIFKPDFTEATSISWEVNLETRAAFIALSQRDIYKAECILAPYVPK
jgi:hypothetical protein